MPESEIPNTPGQYKLNGITIIVLPDKILIKTENRRRSRDYDDDEDEPRERRAKKGEKKGDWLNDILDNAEAIVTGKKRM